MSISPTLKSRQVVAYRLSNLNLTLQEIGDVFDLSRERVRQILCRSNVPTRNNIPPLHGTCHECGKRTVSIKTIICHECHHARHTSTYYCDYCGDKFILPLSQRNHRIKKGQTTFCCSKSCRSLLMWRIRKNEA